MSRKTILSLLVVVAAAAGAYWIHLRNTAPLLVPTATAQRERLVSSLTTNGKVEPSDWVSVRAERPGLLEKLDVQKGQSVKSGQLLAELDSRDARAEVQGTEASVTQARAQLETLGKGGAAAARVEIENEYEKTKFELGTVQRDYEALKRLSDKQAATQHEVQAAAERVQGLQTALQSLERKKNALVEPADRTAAEAKVREAQATLEQARSRLERSHLHSPMTGVVYELPVREGVYLNVGDLVASVGNLKTLRVRIYVDEPELGRVGVGMAVNVTWDAVPGRVWKGRVEKLPAEVMALGTRQVGEVICTIENDDMRLLPGTNVNVEITSQVVENGLTIPKEAIRTENGQTGVYIAKNARAEWRPLKLGAASITRAVVMSGLEQGDQVILRTDQPLHNGDSIRIATQ